MFWKLGGLNAFVAVLSGKVCLSFNLESSSSLKSNEVVFELPDVP